MALLFCGQQLVNEALLTPNYIRFQTLKVKVLLWHCIKKDT